MELQLGIMTNQELADWFGISLKTFTNNRLKKLEELKDYACFEPLRGKVNILRIDIPVHVKKGSKQFNIIKSHIDETWAASGLDTKKNVSNQIYARREEYGITVSSNTNYSYVCKGANQLYGKPKEMGKGEIGRCRYALCVLDAITGEIRWFSEDEYKKKKELQEKYLKPKSNKDLQDQKEALFKQERDGEITETEAAILIHQREKQLYFDYLDALEKVIENGILVYRTYVQRDREWSEKIHMVKEGDFEFGI